MKRFVLLLLFVFTGALTRSQTIKVMLVTGGHSYDTLKFFQMFDALEGVDYEHFEQPTANHKLVNDLAEDYDVLVFYDMWHKISEEEKSAYIELGTKGKPFLFLHHSLASYQDWPEFEKIAGGKYIEKNVHIPVEMQSTYKHDVWVHATVENDSPVTAGFSELRIFDEVYGNIRISEDVKPLLRTEHPLSSDYVAWENTYQASRVVYLQPGHDRRCYESEPYRKLLLQAIKYLAINDQ